MNSSSGDGSFKDDNALYWAHILAPIPAPKKRFVSFGLMDSLKGISYVPPVWALTFFEGLWTRSPCFEGGT